MYFNTKQAPWGPPVFSARENSPLDEWTSYFDQWLFTTGPQSQTNIKANSKDPCCSLLLLLLEVIQLIRIHNNSAV